MQGRALELIMFAGRLSAIYRKYRVERGTSHASNLFYIKSDRLAVGTIGFGPDVYHGVVAIAVNVALSSSRHDEELYPIRYKRRSVTANGTTYHHYHHIHWALGSRSNKWRGQKGALASMKERDG